ncbi:MAG: hypothetical protein ACRC37_01480 [Lentisphaeria bacterium]
MKLIASMAIALLVCSCSTTCTKPCAKENPCMKKSCNTCAVAKPAPVAPTCPTKTCNTCNTCR